MSVLLSDKPLPQKLVNLPRDPRASHDYMSRLKALGHLPCCCYGDKLAQRSRQSMGIWADTRWQSSRRCQRGLQFQLAVILNQGGKPLKAEWKHSRIKPLLPPKWFHQRLSVIHHRCRAPGHPLQLEGRKFLTPEVGPLHLLCKAGGVEDGCFSNGWNVT